MVCNISQSFSRPGYPTHIKHDHHIAGSVADTIIDDAVFVASAIVFHKTLFIPLFCCFLRSVVQQQLFILSFICHCMILFVCLLFTKIFNSRLASIFVHQHTSCQASKPTNQASRQQRTHRIRYEVIPKCELDKIET